MPRVPEPADFEALRPVLVRLALLDAEVQAVTQTVLEELTALEAGPAQQTLSDIGDALVDAFSTLADSLEETHRLAGGRIRPREIDLTVVRPLDRVAR